MPSENMTKENKTLKEKCSEFERLLREARKEAGYYQRIAQDAGKKHLREIDQLSRLITERRQAVEALRRSEEKYRSVFENTGTATIIIEKDMEISMANTEFEKLSGYSKKELEGKKSWTEFVVEEDLERMKEYHVKRRQNGVESPPEYEFRFIDRQGDMKYIFNKVAIIPGTGKSIASLMDITEKKQLEAQFQQTQRMEAIGTLAGGIAHDFNNLLMGIQGCKSFMSMDISPSHPHYDTLKTIEDLVRSGANLTRQILGFARGGKYEVKPADLNELVERSSRMFGTTKKEIRIHTRYQEDIWAVEVDTGQIEQVLLNLYVNAWQAMPGGGDLYIQTENIALGEDYVNHYRVGPGRYVSISVIDTGTGMDESVQQRIFEPFYTTRAIGRGTGLGLATAYGIIKDHGGNINVNSKKGEGTTFNIYLPASEKEILKEKELSEQTLKGVETVLLVDDEDVIVDIGEKILKLMGYKVLTARNGKEAVNICKENQDKIDIVILDIIMPDMGGGEAFDKMKEIDPKIRVLLSSGYDINTEATEIMERGCDGFIQKPFTFRNLSQKMRGILEKK